MEQALPHWILKRVCSWLDCRSLARVEALNKGFKAIQPKNCCVSWTIEELALARPTALARPLHLLSDDANVVLNIKWHSVFHGSRQDDDDTKNHAGNTVWPKELQVARLLLLHEGYSPLLENLTSKYDGHVDILDHVCVRKPVQSLALFDLVSRSPCQMRCWETETSDDLLPLLSSLRFPRLETLNIKYKSDNRGIDCVQRMPTAFPRVRFMSLCNTFKLLDAILPLDAILAAQSRSREMSCSFPRRLETSSRSRPCSTHTAASTIGAKQDQEPIRSLSSSSLASTIDDNFKHLESLDFCAGARWSEFDDMFVDSGLSSLLSRTRVLKHLVVEYIAFTTSDIEILVACCPGLQSINLKEQDTVHALDYLPVLGQLKDLQSLTIFMRTMLNLLLGTKLTVAEDAELKSLSLSLSSSQSPFPKLETLVLGLSDEKLGHRVGPVLSCLLGSHQGVATGLPGNLVTLGLVLAAAGGYHAHNRNNAAVCPEVIDLIIQTVKGLPRLKRLDISYRHSIRPTQIAQLQAELPRLQVCSSRLF